MESAVTNLHPNIKAMAPMLEGVIKLLHPYAEGAIHDLQTGKIAALYNNYSRRKIGDISAISELGVEVKDFPDFFEPYYKTNWDGKKLKCTSITIRDDVGKPIGLICINFDTTDFENINLQLSAFLTLKGKGGLNPVEQFTDNWRQQVLAYIEEYTTDNNVALTALSKEEKSELVRKLYDHGLFNYRDAAVYIAQTLGVSRTTIYNYLKEHK
ncbi:MAG: PAS domain-containing protein [Candidatus Saccharimonadales bacterium]